MKSKKNNRWEYFTFIFIYLIVFLFCSCRTAYPQTQTDYSIVGTWIAKPDGISQWVFTKDSKVKIYLKYNLMHLYTYDLSRDPNQCGYNFSERFQKYKNDRILILTDLQTNNKRCYYVYGFNQEVLAMRFFGSNDILLFKRQDTPDIPGIDDGRLEENDGHP